MDDFNTENGEFATLMFLGTPTEKDGDEWKYVSCLRTMLNSAYGWCNPKQTPRQHSLENKEIPYWAGSIARSLQAQGALAIMDKNMFQPFPLCAEQ